MSVPRRILPALLALVLGVLSAWALAACGEERDRTALIPRNDARALTDALETARSALADGRCDDAARAADDVRSAASDLPGRVDAKLRQRIREGADALIAEIGPDCEATTTQETIPTVETTETQTVPEETVPEETVPEETTPTVPPETTPPAETTPTTPQETVPDGTGGFGDDEGVIP